MQYLWLPDDASYMNRNMLERLLSEGESKRKGKIHLPALI